MGKPDFDKRFGRYQGIEHRRDEMPARRKASAVPALKRSATPDRVQFGSPMEFVYGILLQASATSDSTSLAHRDRQNINEPCRCSAVCNRQSAGTQPSVEPRIDSGLPPREWSRA